jgi:hypothetical protein
MCPGVTPAPCAARPVAWLCEARPTFARAVPTPLAVPKQGR